MARNNTRPKLNTWRRVELPNGRAAVVMTRVDPARGRIVIVKPIRGK